MVLPNQLHRLEPLLPGLLATRPEFPFGDGVNAARAFLLQSDGDDDDKNVLLYANAHIRDYADHIKELGQPSHQLLTHRDEASEACNVLEAKVFCHEKERAAIEAKGSRVDETFAGSSHDILETKLTAHHAPGHTPGVAIYHWRQSSESSVLFTGDTLYGSSTGDLDYAPLFIHPYPAGKKEDYARTLGKIRTLRPSVIVPGLSAAGTFVFPFDDKKIIQLQKKLQEES